MSARQLSKPDGWGRDYKSMDSSWAEIRDAAIQVVLLTRHADGFWSIPTIAAEVSDTYAAADSREEEIRLRDSFGHASVTASVNALEALSFAMGAAPQKIVSSVFVAIETHRGKHGGYGTPVPRKDRVEVNAVPRHTAMAALAHLRFSSSGSLITLAQHLEATVKWLLANQLRAGGWPYDWTSPPHSVGFLSTSSAICALCLWLELGGLPKAMTAQAKTAVRKGYDSLLSCHQNAIWDGDGAPAAYQVLDSAFALRLLRLADRNGTLTSLASDEAETPRQLVAHYCLNALEFGWPNNVVSQTASAVTSVSALQLVLEAGDPFGLGDKYLSVVESEILTAWRNGSLCEDLTAWDWQCLAMLAALKAGPVASGAAGTLVNRCEAIRRSWREGSLRPRDLAWLHHRARNVITFSLTYGEGFKANAVTRGFRELPRTIISTVIQNLIWTALVALIGALLSYVALF